MADRKDLEVESKGSTKHNETASSDPSAALKLDPHGFPLRPQPSDDPLGTNTTLEYTCGVFCADCS
jgi:hypothetical protein